MPTVTLYAAAVEPTFVSMGGSVRHYRAVLIENYLESEGIARIWGAGILTRP